MKMPSNSDAYQVLLLQAADEGRGPTLFGPSAQRARTLLQPFMVGNEFPSVYFEFPLMGNPFLDVTMLYGHLEPNTRIDSPAAEGSDRMLDWFAGICKEYSDIACGFELDTKNSELPTAAIHFQPRSHTELVAPFCDAVGEPERATLYLELAERMAEYWPLSFFGMFRGRPGSPLRVCGYLSPEEQETCAQNPQRLNEVFQKTGFTAYDDAMLKDVSTLMAYAPEAVDFQFDVYPDGSLGSTFAIDLQFGLQQPAAVQQAFTDGKPAQAMQYLETRGVADKRWKLGVEAAFARSIPVELEDGSFGKYSFTLMPQWAKARWIDGVLQPAKLYLYGQAGLLAHQKPNEAHANES